MDLFNIFKRGATAKELETRRKFIRNSLAGAFGAAALANADKLFAERSKTGFSFIKPDGEIINHYDPSEGINPYVGQIDCVGFNFAPQGWLRCDGQLLPIAENETLFVLIGTTYGGDGQATFALPDLRGRVNIHQGTGPGLTQKTLGETGGAEAVTLTLQQIPAHNHSLNVKSNPGTSANPSANILSQNADGVRTYSASSNALLNSGTIGNSGGSQPHNNMDPFLTLNWIISLFGVFPNQ